jgi:rubrerythrin
LKEIEMTKKDSVVYAPWNKEQVDALNFHQENPTELPFPGYPPYVCSECVNLLKATEDGWVCPNCGQKSTEAFENTTLSMHEMEGKYDKPPLM